jgi:hypothetical protein
VADKAIGPAPKKANGGITKIDAVQQALSKLGKAASRPEIQKFVKDSYGLQMTLDHISNCKGELRKRKGPAKKAVAQQPAKPAVSQQPAAQKQEPKKPASGSKGHAIGLDDIETVKDLVERVGAGSLRKLIDVMAR